jgi:hypothetical protein
MELWHMTLDAPRVPMRVGPGDDVTLHAGTWPIAPGQSVWASVSIEGADGTSVRRVERGRWLRNQGQNSHWEIVLGRFRKGDRVTYTVLGESEPGAVVAATARSFRVGDRSPCSCSGTGTSACRDDEQRVSIEEFPRVRGAGQRPQEAAAVSSRTPSHAAESKPSAGS